MKQALKRVLPALLALALLLGPGLPALAGNSGVTGPSGQNFGGGTGQTDFSPITLTIYAEDMRDEVVKENFQGIISQQITADTGVTVKSVFGVGDVSEQITLMIADRSYPDFVFSRSNSGKFLEAEAFIDLAPLIEEYGPNIKKLYGASWPSHYDDQGRIFYLGQDFVNNLPLDPESSFQLQHDVVRELGYPRIRTVEDYSAAIREYIKLHPEIDGQPTIGMSLICSDGWRWFITLGNPAGFAAGYADDGNYAVNPETMEAVYRFTLPDHREYYRWMNGIYDEGLLDPDSFTQTYDEYLQKIATGRVLGLADADWEFGSAESTLAQEGRFERTYGRYPVTLGQGGLDLNYRKPLYMATNGVGITDNCADPVRAIQFLDYLAREEIQVMTNWGFEGVHWEIKDGRRQFTAEETALRAGSENRTTQTGMGLMSYPWPCYGSGVYDKDGYSILPYDEATVLAEYNEVEKEVLAGYGVQMWRDLFPQQDEIYFAPWGNAWIIADNLRNDIPLQEELNLIQARLNDITAEYLPKAVTAAPADFDKVYDEFLEKLNAANAARAGELMTVMVKEQAEWYTDFNK